MRSVALYKRNFHDGFIEGIIGEVARGRRLAPGTPCQSGNDVFPHRNRETDMSPEGVKSVLRSHLASID